MQHQEDRFLREAWKNRDRDTQRRALLRLLDLSHSESTESKKFAAAQFKHYISLFPDLEDAVINAIYDLCEDQASFVRIQGYQAISAVSRHDVNWVKRNADVLVQLLQSDERDEVVYIRKGLDEHLDLAPDITMGVLCDQITNVDEPIDEEDKIVRDRLRTLVLGFIKERMKKILSILKGEPGGDPERILVDGVLKAIPKSGLADTSTIVKDILLCLPSYKYRSPEGEKILVSILAKAERSLEEELHQKGEKSSLELTRSYLELAGLVAGTACRTLPLLRFYFNFVVSYIHLLTADTQLFVIHNIGTHLGSYSNIDRSQEALAARKQSSDRSHFLLKALAETGISDPNTWKACRVLLNACVEREKELLPQSYPLRDSPDILRKIQRMALDQKMAQAHPEKDDLQEVYDLIRSLLTGGLIKSNSTGADVPFGSSWRPNKRKFEPESGQTVLRQETPPNQQRRHSTEEASGRSASPNMIKTEEAEAQPSLLSRLDPSRETSNGLGPIYRSPPSNYNINMSQRPNWRTELSSRQQGPIQLPPSLPKKPEVPLLKKEHVTVQKQSDLFVPVREDEDKHPVTGFSIKGAARGPTDTQGLGLSIRGVATSEGESLLDRMDDERNVRRRKTMRGGRGY